MVTLKCQNVQELLLKTQRQVHTEIKCGGDYIYIGISNGISRVFASNPYLQMDSNTIDLVVNVDEVPLHKSSSTQIWPIICKFINYPAFIVSFFCGSKKPDDSEEFLCKKKLYGPFLMDGIQLLQG